LVVPSHTENVGMVIAEGLAHGVPVIASPGTPWARLQSEGCGSWIQNDPSTIAATIQSYFAVDLQAMGQRGREWMKAEFGWDAVAAEMRQLYEDLLNAG